MKQAIQYSLLNMLIVSLILNSCKKGEGTTTNQATSFDDAMDDTSMLFLESVRDTTINLKDIILDNGQNVPTFLNQYDPGFSQPSGSRSNRALTNLTPRLQKLTFMARMLAIGNNLINDYNYTYDDEGPGKPAQDGLAYSWGSKDQNIRQVPPGPGNQCTDLKIHGLDCTGMMYVMTTTAGIQVRPASNFYVQSVSDPDVWTNAFKASQDFKDLKMKNMGKLPPGDMKDGDIVIWPRHIAYYLHGYLFQSNGTPSSPGCKGNLSSSRGPRLLLFSEILTWTNFNANYKVFRVTSGNDYKLTASVNLVGFPVEPTTPYLCKLGPYVDEVSVSITVTETDQVIVNYINNFDPPVVYESASQCQCLGMSFINKSAIDVTDVKAFLLSAKNLYFNMTYTFCMPTMKYDCGGLSNPTTVDGYNSAGIQVEDSIKIPGPGEGPTSAKWNIWNGGTVTLSREDK